MTPTLDDIIRKNLEAIGGKTAVESIHNLRMRIRIAEGDSILRGEYVADESARMRIDIFDKGQRVYSECFDGQHAWYLPQGETERKREGDEAAAALWHGVEFPGKIFWLYQMEKRGTWIEFVGTERVDDIEYLVLKLKMKDGFVARLYLNSGTFLIERMRDKRALHPDVDSNAIRTETWFSNFRKVGGALRSLREQQVDLDTGRIVSTTEIESVEVNLEIDDKLFSMR